MPGQGAPVADRAQAGDGHHRLAASDLSPYAPADLLWWFGVVVSTAMLLLELAVQPAG